MSVKFREYKGLDLTKVADETLQFWEENEIFQKSISSRDENKPFIFYQESIM
jgi:isoleucyl-tRNA synthetase